jgi:metal-sulfur cluster biosynthetic enzyme
MSVEPRWTDDVSDPAGSGERRDQVVAALTAVHDPCSVALNNPLSIVDMGLVRAAHLRADGVLHVTLCVTGPGCFMAPKFAEAARERLAALPFVERVEVDFDATVLWTPEDMTAHGRELQRLRHERSRSVSPVRPQQWREQVVSG